MQRLAQCPAATAGAALLGAVALLAQEDYRVETLAPDPSPPSLYLVALSESGSQKTTAFKLLAQGHQEADTLLEARWNVAQELYHRRDHEGGGGWERGPEPGTRRPRPSTPVSLLQDFTTDGLLQQLHGGRPSIAMWTAEAGTQINHSFGRNQAPRTVSYLNSGWESGQLSKIRARNGSQIHIGVDTYSMSMVWAGQPDILAPVLFGAMALNGLLARCLIFRDDAYADPGRARAHDRDRVQAFNRVVVRHRERQDREMEFASRPGEPPRERTLIALSGGARGLLDEFYAQQRSLAARLREDLLKKSPAEMQHIRGRQICMILQDPMTSLNPVYTVGNQLVETLRMVKGLGTRGLLHRAIDALANVKIASPESRVSSFPHQMSGGMRQRVAGAIAIAGLPKVLIADEATTSLDATIQLQYLQLLKDLQAETGLSIIFITHDFGIVAKMCDRVAVMYAGKIVENAGVRDLFNNPSHPYTEALIRSVPNVDEDVDNLYSIEGQPPALDQLPEGCTFAPRCPYVFDRCLGEFPTKKSVSDNHFATCWRLE